MRLIVVTLLSTIAFSCLRKLASFVFNDKYLKNIHVQKNWLWRNTFVSLIHAIVSSALTLYCFLDKPYIFHDLIHTSTISSRLLVSFSIGYFIYDLADIVRYYKLQQLEYLFHHIVSIAAVTVPLVTNKLLSMAVWGFLMEYNTIFLHTRQLMKLANAKDTSLYRVNKYFNLITMVTLRICTSLWSFGCLLQYGDQIPFAQFLWSVLCLGFLVINNFRLFFILIKSD